MDVLVTNRVLEEIKDNIAHERRWSGHRFRDHRNFLAHQIGGLAADLAGG
jgi:hypothetical protein